MAKKKYSEEVQNAYDAYGSEVQSAGQALTEGMTAAGQQQIADMEAANKAYNDANNAAIEANRQRSDAAIGSFADMVEGYAQNIRNAEAESAAQVAADQRAARWTGATELASSIANLIAVGGHNAVSQQYKPYSQDWMRKADQDARLNRARIDNLRERQRAMQGQLANMRMNDAARALELARADAKARYDQGLALSQARYNTTVNPLVQAGKTAEEVGKINAQGAAQAANIGLHERQLAQQAAHQQAQLDETRRYHDEQITTARMKAAGNSDKNNMSILVNLDGQDVTLNIPKENYAAALERGVPDLREDVLAMAKKQGFKGDTWEDLVAANGRSGMSKKELKKAGGGEQYEGDLSGIISIIENQPDAYTEEDLKQINNFLKGSYKSTQKFNEHLSKVSSGAIGWERKDDRESAPTPSINPPAGSEVDPENRTINFEDKSQTEQTGMPTAATKRKSASQSDDEKYGSIFG